MSLSSCKFISDRIFVLWPIAFLLDLPQAVGLLPKWQLLVSSLAVFNTIQNFLTLSLTKRIYSKQPHNGASLTLNSQSTSSYTRFVQWPLFSRGLLAYGPSRLQSCGSTARTTLTKKCMSPPPCCKRCLWPVFGLTKVFTILQCGPMCSHSYTSLLSSSSSARQGSDLVSSALSLSQVSIFIFIFHSRMSIV